MGKVKKRFRDLSLKTTFVVYVLTMLIASTLVCLIAVSWLENYRNEVNLTANQPYQEYEIPTGGSYLTTYDGSSITYTIVNNAGEVVDSVQADGVSQGIALEYRGGYDDGVAAFEFAQSDNALDQPNMIVVYPILSEEQRTRDYWLALSIVAVFPISYGGGAVLCAIWFYRKKLKRPIELLQDGAARISNQDLNFTVEWQRRDEMGRLCDAFEQMRAALDAGNRKLWRQMEERRRLNAAFSHDLRTPLTVLKGHAAMLEENLRSDADRTEMLGEVMVMQTHVARLEHYVQAMNGLRRLEDIEPHICNVPLDKLTDGLRDISRMLSGNIRCCSHVPDESPIVAADQEMVTQVFENLMANAVRYAREKTEVDVALEEGMLKITVSDDGKGFSPEALKKACDPFYREEKQDNIGHLGLGLHICKILCQRHGGILRIENKPDGGGRVQAAFCINQTPEK